MILPPEARTKDICATRVRYGYRRVHLLLRRVGWAVNTKRIYRLYKGMGQQLRSKAPRRRVKATLREDRQLATQPNETWAMDFVYELPGQRVAPRIDQAPDHSRYAPGSSASGPSPRRSTSGVMAYGKVVE